MIPMFFSSAWMILLECHESLAVMRIGCISCSVMGSPWARWLHMTMVVLEEFSLVAILA